MISAQYLLTALVVVLMPGAGNLYTLAIGLGRGRAAAVAAATGCTIGILPHLAAASLGLAAVLHTSALLFNALKFAGAAYLIWIAWGALRETGAVALRPRAEPESLWRTARRAVLINSLNPKLSIFFLALLPPFLSGNPATATMEMMELSAVFIALTYVVFVLAGIFAASVRHWLLASERAMLWLNRSFAAVFALLALRLALQRQ